MEHSFIWQPKFTRMLKDLPSEYFLVLVDWIINYGSYHTEPEFLNDEPMLTALFEAFRDDIDSSRYTRITALEIQDD